MIRRTRCIVIIEHTNKWRSRMKQITIIVLALATAMAATGCKRASDVLATYKGGRVARGEFHEWMDARRMEQEAILKKKTQQKTHLERLVIEKLSVQEAKKAGFDKRED